MKELRKKESVSEITPLDMEKHILPVSFKRAIQVRRMLQDQTQQKNLWKQNWETLLYLIRDTLKCDRRTAKSYLYFILIIRSDI